MSSTDRRPGNYTGNYTLYAYLCLYGSCTRRLACRATEEVLCIHRTVCLDPTSPCLTCGVDCSGENASNATNRSICCQVGCGFCEVALQEPRILCGVAHHVLCLRTVGSLPLHGDYVETPICAYYCIQCYPTLDIAAPAPLCPMLGDHQEAPAVTALAMEDREPEDRPPPQQPSFVESPTPVAVAECIQVLPHQGTVDPNPLLSMSSAPASAESK
mmetsp:Transcript_11254/g.23026  ORF Transcript_11254/g.23026 Transcript_11254/m.23026 type:complete len:215 (-) Transcript_11254:214-858(-)